jgi:hypothetical protein
VHLHPLSTASVDWHTATELLEGSRGQVPDGQPTQFGLRDLYGPAWVDLLESQADQADPTLETTELDFDGPWQIWDLDSHPARYGCRFIDRHTDSSR